MSFMDVLQSIPVSAIYHSDDFKIVVQSATEGWMHLDILTENVSFGYNASNIVNPLNDLFRDSILIITKKPIKNSIDYWYGCTIAEHFLDSGDVILWMFYMVEDALNIYIWKNTSMELLEELYYCGFDSEKYFINSHKNAPNLNEGLLLAVQIPPTVFAETLINTYNQMEQDFGDDDRDEWGFDYSKNYMGLLTYFVKTHSEVIVE